MKFSTEKVICPYFIRRSRFTISCSGIIGERDQLTRFEDPAEVKGYMKSHCEKRNYAVVCPLAIYLEDKYSDENQHRESKQHHISTRANEVDKNAN